MAVIRWSHDDTESAARAGRLLGESTDPERRQAAAWLASLVARAQANADAPGPPGSLGGGFTARQAVSRTGRAYGHADPYNVGSRPKWAKREGE